MKMLTGILFLIFNILFITSCQAPAKHPELDPSFNQRSLPAENQAKLDAATGRL